MKTRSVEFQTILRQIPSFLRWKEKAQRIEFKNSPSSLPSKKSFQSLSLVKIKTTRLLS